MLQTKVNCYPALIGFLVLIILSCDKHNEELFNGVFYEKGELVSVKTLQVINITSTTATIKGSITNNGNCYIVERGLCYSTKETPSILNNKVVNGNDLGDYECTIINLIKGTNYYVRAYAKNSKGVSYGDEISFITWNIPNVLTLSVTEIDNDTAKISGQIVNDGGDQILQKGVCWSTTQNPTVLDSFYIIESELDMFDTYISDLLPNTTYYCRAFATNSTGTAYGENLMFTTLGPPTIKTNINNIAINDALIESQIVNDGGSLISEKGVFWGKYYDVEISGVKVSNFDEDLNYTVVLSSLEPNTSYYIKGFATNKYGTNYSNIEKITTYNTDAIKDIDNNYYNIVVIGSQTWLKENLRTTNYSNGNSIAYITDDTEWSNQTNGAYCWPENNEMNKNIYGALYNWHTVATNQLCPIGWHVPSSEEFEILLNHLGGGEFAGGKMKEAGFDHWVIPNMGATNSSGFTALPSGYREENLGYFNRTWTSTKYIYNENNAMVIGLDYDNSRCGIYQGSQILGFSVRCIKDL